MARVDYPDYAETLSRKIAAGEAENGVLICGSGIGMSIAANKIPGIRAAVVENPIAARLAREHNNANVLCLGARFTADEYAIEIVATWLEAKFDPQAGGGRHQGRIEKITKLESC
jgi:ribose 5-phosphate isomerase B